MAEDEKKLDWANLHGVAYRRVEVYHMLWKDMDLERYHVVGAPHGGPIAIVRDEQKVMLLGAGDDDSVRPMMRIYTANGTLISEFLWSHKNLVGLGWTSREELVCVFGDGNAHIYTLHGDRSSVFDLGKACQEDGVAEVHIWGEGLVARTRSSAQLVYISSFNAPRPTKLADASKLLEGKPPAAMCVVPPHLSDTEKVQVLLAAMNGNVICVDEKSADDQQCKLGPFSKMALSPGGINVACFGENGSLYVLPVSFSGPPVTTFPTNSKKPPKDMVWCGEDSVALYWTKMLLVVDHYGNFLKFSYEGALVMVPECDGVRLFTREKCEFLQPVPEATVAIFGSTPESAALLYNASSHFEERSVKADDFIRQIKGKDELGSAIDQCLAAAAHEFDHDKQRKLLKAASFGKLFCDEYKADHFVDMCRILRVLNAIRHASVAIPITFDQYSKLEAEIVVDRLINRHHHLLALRICQFLLIKPDRVLVHWACAKIKNSDDDTDEALCGIIHQKLQVCPGVSFSEIAKTAYSSGRQKLATMLLEYEPLASDQVPLLLSMNEAELALDKAIESGDTDLVYLALLQIQKSRTTVAFFNLIMNKPLARNLFISYCKQDLPTLKSFYAHLQQASEAANVCVREAYAATTLSERLEKLEVAKRYFKEDKNNPTGAELVADEMQLLEYQKECQDAAKTEQFMDLSLSQVLEKHILSGDVRAALKVQKKFHVGEKRLMHIEVKTLAKCKHWQELAKLAVKTPVIGFEPFIEACLEQKALTEASTYIKRLSDPHKKMEWLCNIGYWKEAAEIAAADRDVEALRTIRQSCRNPQVVALVDRWLSGQGALGTTSLQ